MLQCTNYKLSNWLVSLPFLCHYRLEMLQLTLNVPVRSQVPVTTIGSGSGGSAVRVTDQKVVGLSTSTSYLLLLDPWATLSASGALYRDQLPNKLGCMEKLDLDVFFHFSNNFEQSSDWIFNNVCTFTTNKTMQVLENVKLKSFIT